MPSRAAEIDLAQDMVRVATEMQAVAARGRFDGHLSLAAHAYLQRCRRIHGPTRTVLLFTRDTGHHTSGWLRNPDYERCLHLSLSPAPGAVVTLRPVVAELAQEIQRRWCETFFGEHLRYLWAESPKSRAGQRCRVWHWRLFCDEHWQPILPRGEVYSSDFTEVGWQSASEVFGLTGQPEPVSTVDPT